MPEPINRNYSRVFREAAQDRCLEVAEMIAAEARANAAQRFKKKETDTEGKAPRKGGGTGALAAGYAASRDGRTSAKITGVSYWAHVEYGHALKDDQGRPLVNKDGVVQRVGQKPHVRPAIESVRKQLGGGA